MTKEKRECLLWAERQRLSQSTQHDVEGEMPYCEYCRHHREEDDTCVLPYADATNPLYYPCAEAYINQKRALRKNRKKSAKIEEDI